MHGLILVLFWDMTIPSPSRFYVLYLITFDGDWPGEAQVIEDRWEGFDEIVSNDSSDDESYNSVILINKREIENKQQF